MNLSEAIISGYNRHIAKTILTTRCINLLLGESILAKAPLSAIISTNKGNNNTNDNKYLIKTKKEREESNMRTKWF